MGAKESHINNSKDIEVRVALPTNTAHETVQLSIHKMHITRIFSVPYSLLLEDSVSISSQLSSLEVSTSISSLSLLTLSSVLGDSVVFTSSFFSLHSLFCQSVRTTNLFALFLFVCTLIPPIIHKDQHTISKFFLH